MDDRSWAVAGMFVGVHGFYLMRPIGWEWAGAMWVYVFVWFLFNEVVKVHVLRYYHKKFSKGVL